MEFLVKISPKLPVDYPENRKAELYEAERARGTALLEQGRIRRMWRLPGTASAVQLWDVSGPEELHTLLSSLPMWSFCEVDVTTLIQHPLETTRDKYLERG